MLRPKQYVKKSPHRLPHIRRSTRPQSIFKRLGRGVVIAALGAVNIALAIWLSLQVWEVLTTDREFAVSEIHVIGAKSIPVDTIMKRSRVKVGDNIFKIDLKGAQSILEAEPQFRQVEVWRQLPKDIFIRVDEREPVAQIQSASGDHCWLVDAEYVAMGPCQPGKETFPTIIGVDDLHAFKRGVKLDRAGYLNALKILSLLSDSALKKLFQLERVIVEASDDIVMVGQDQMSVKLGHEDFENRLLKFYSILEDLKKKSKTASAVDLRFKYVPVVLKATDKKKQTS